MNFIVLMIYIGAGVIFFFVLFMLLMQLSIGFRNWLAFFKARLGVKKGFGHVRMIHPTGTEELIACKFTGDYLEPFGKEKGKYVFKSECVGLGAFNIPTISYRYNDADPIDPKNGLMTATSPQILENLIARAVNAEKGVSGEFEWLKKNWKTLGIGLLILVGLFLFGYMQSLEAVTACYQETAGRVIINASGLGR